MLNPLETSEHKSLVVRVRRARQSDSGDIASIESAHTGQEKEQHWKGLLAECRKKGGVALVAEHEDRVCGYLLGDVRAWEFGSAPTGWIYSVAVAPEVEGASVGSRLLEAAVWQFREQGVEAVRTMVQRDGVSLLRFFRSAGFRAGPFVQLEVKI